jgi:hypothetical protein
LSSFWKVVEETEAQRPRSMVVSSLMAAGIAEEMVFAVPACCQVSVGVCYD